MTWGERVQAWLTGRHEFRALVEVDPDRAASLGGRSVVGTTCAEFTCVGHGSRSTARLQAARAVGSMLRSELPEARLLAVRDGGPPREPDPAMRLADGARPKLLLVGPDTGDDAERLVERVCRLWGLPDDRYTSRWTPDRSEMPRIWQVAVAVGCAALVGWPFADAGAAASDAPLLGRLFRWEAPLGQIAIGVALILAALRWREARRRGWTPARRAFAGTQMLVPVGLALTLAVAHDLMSAAAHRFPTAVALVLGVLCLAAAPIGVSRVERPRLWAVLAWGLPLLAGGIAPFVGELILDYYLSAFELDHLDLQVSAWAQWALGALATGLVLLGAYVGVAFWVLFRRLLGPSPAGVFFAVVIALIYALSVVSGTMDGIIERTRPGVDGLPRGLPGLRPVAVCITPVQEPFSYIGRAAPRSGDPAVYLGRADGRLAVWTADTGGVLLDGQQVGLRVVDALGECR